MKRNGWFFAGAAIVVIAVVAAVALALRRPAPPAQSDTSTAPSVALATAHAGTIAVTVPAVGRIGANAEGQTKLSFQVPGRIASMDVHVGDRVSAGQALASLDVASLSLAAQQANADAQAAAAQERAAAIDRTTARIAIDQRALERAQRLYAAGVAAHKDVDAARAQLIADQADAKQFVANMQAARAQYASAVAKAAMASRDANNGTLRAPFSGVVSAVYHNAGESVDPTIAVVALAPPANQHVTLQVSANDAVRVAPDDAVQLRVASGTFAGRVLGIARAVDPATQTADVLVDVGNIPDALAGSSVDAQIVVAHNRGIIVPKDAVVADPASGKTLVFVRSQSKGGDPKFDAREVRVVFQNDTTAEVTGLRDGERIAAAGAFELLAAP
jgi:multidrug efflux pump subunit AcrA (membrane-fusion protein)